MLSWTGHLLDIRTAIGLKKYYFLNEDKTYVPVLIGKDEFGRYGFCSKCDEKMIWKEETGWRHTKDDLEWSETYLSSNFFKIDTELDIN